MSALADRLATLPWLDGEGPWTSAVLSCRARVRRNVAARAFPGRAEPQELTEVRAALLGALVSLPEFEGAAAFDAAVLEPDQRGLLDEAELLPSSGASGPLLLSRDGRYSAYMLGEDHLELTAARPGLDPGTALRGALALERALEQQVDWAFDPVFGYLTADPVLCGTGVALEAHLHLPGLLIDDELTALLDGIAARGLAFAAPRGAEGEIHGGLLVVRTAATLGRSEKVVGRDFAREVAEIVALETAARRRLLDADRLTLADRVHRALGILHHCRLLPEAEARNHLAMIRLGRTLGLLAAEGPSTDLLLRRLQPFHLAAWAASQGEEGPLDAVRARLLRRALGGISD